MQTAQWDVRPRRVADVRLRIVAVAVLATALAGCAAQQASVVSAAPAAVLGFDEIDMRMCAGFPTRTARYGNVEVWTYEHAAEQTGGVNLSLPTVVPSLGGNVNLSGGTGYCHLQVKFVDGKVVELGYAGDNDVGPVQNALCAPIIKNCVGYHPAAVPAAAAKAPASMPSDAKTNRPGMNRPPAAVPALPAQIAARDGEAAEDRNASPPVNHPPADALPSSRSAPQP